MASYREIVEYVLGEVVHEKKKGNARQKALLVRCDLLLTGLTGENNGHWQNDPFIDPLGHLSDAQVIREVVRDYCLTFMARHRNTPLTTNAKEFIHKAMKLLEKLQAAPSNKT